MGGHDTGLFSTDLLTASGADGGYAIGDVPAGSLGSLYFRRAGFEELTTPVQVAPGAVTRIDVAPLRRDYASLASGSVVAAFTGPNYAGDGCGPQHALDDDTGTVWSTTTGAGPRDLIIDLGRSVDLRSVRIDPSAGCGDGPGASLHQYELAASDGNGAPFEPLAAGTVGPTDPRGYATLPLAGDLGGRRLLRLRAIAPRSADEPFMDVAELEVTGTPLPPPAPAPPQRRRQRRPRPPRRRRSPRCAAGGSRRRAGARWRSRSASRPTRRAAPPACTSAARGASCWRARARACGAGAPSPCACV